MDKAGAYSAEHDDLDVENAGLPGLSSNQFARQ